MAIREHEGKACRVRMGKVWASGVHWVSKRPPGAPSVLAARATMNLVEPLRPREYSYIADLQKKAVAEWLQSFNSVRGPMKRLEIT